MIDSNTSNDNVSELQSVSMKNSRPYWHNWLALISDWAVGQEKNYTIWNKENKEPYDAAIVSIYKVKHSWYYQKAKYRDSANLYFDMKFRCNSWSHIIMLCSKKEQIPQSCNPERFSF